MYNLSHIKSFLFFLDPTSPLPTGCALDAVLNVQKLDFLDIEGVYPLYQMLLKHLEDHPDDRWT